ncbi:DUF1697 domain-containing protein [Salipiger sp.]|uniref:DUF1697 domain-containing protein n=1 Tax=Salipiger sp. TaxID=2078585 RepID=UPI003A9838C3
MPDRVALLRGINVGGANRLPMAELRTFCAGLGWQEVATHVASGNVLFRADGTPDSLSAALHDALKAGTGLDVPVLVLAPEVLRHAVEDCPFDPQDDRLVHAAFAFAVPAPDRDLFERFAADGDGLEAGRGLVWLHTPGGFGRSKVAERLERIVGCPITARNLRSLRELVAMLDARGGA